MSGTKLFVIIVAAIVMAPFVSCVGCVGCAAVTTAGVAAAGAK